MNPEEVLNIYNAYKDDVMTPPHRAGFLEAVRSGKQELPPDSTLLPEDALPLDPEALVGYRSGNWTREDKQALERHVKMGIWALPEGEQLEETPDLSVLETIQEMFTGADQMTDEINEMKDWGEMPELNDFSWPGWKAAMGTIATAPEESVKILKAQFPDMGIRQDAKGNFILKSTIDDKEYAIKPGFRAYDLVRAAGVAAAFAPTGRFASVLGQAAGAAGTQAAIEGTQAATGGDIDVEEIGMAGGTAGAMTGAGKLIGKGYEAFFNRAAAAKTADDLSSLVTTTKRASRGKAGAVEELSEVVAPDPKTVAAAERLGIQEYLQADHVTTNQKFRELSQAIKTSPGSEARREALRGYEQIARRADDIITEIGGADDLSLIDVSVKTELRNIQGSLLEKSDALYAEIAKAVDPKMPVTASTTVNWLKAKAKDLGGEQYLSTAEKQLLKALTPEKGPRGQFGKGPTYARIDNIRRQLTAARVRKQGEFKDADSGLIKKLEKLLMEDQRKSLVKVSPEILNKFDDARSLVATRKAIEDDLTAIFGRHLDKTIVGKLGKGIKDLPKGDAVQFNEFINRIPKDMRKEVVATGLNTAFGKTARQGDLNFNFYADWYEGLLRNKGAYRALMNNLPQHSRKRLSDLYRVAKGIRLSDKSKDIQAATSRMLAADGFMDHLYDLVRRGSYILQGRRGAGVAATIGNLLTPSGNKMMAAADNLIMSPQFINLVNKQTKEAASQFTRTPAWKRFIKLLPRDRVPTDPEKWLLASMQTYRNLYGEEDKGEQ